MASANRLYTSVPLPKIPRSYYDLSYNNLMLARIGQILPIQCDEVVPGDVWKMGQGVVVRPFEGAVHNPVMHELNVHVASFFVPNRLLQGPQTEYDAQAGEQSFQDMITGGREGKLKIVPPSWSSSIWRGYKLDNSKPVPVPEPLLSDYLHIPRYFGQNGASSFQPVLYPYRAYRFIYNTYFRDANLEDPIPVTFNSKTNDLMKYDEILTCCYEKDYFTSALPDTQRGPLPTIPFTGSAPVTGDFSAGYSFISNLSGLGFSDNTRDPSISGTISVKNSGNGNPNLVYSNSVDGYLTGVRGNSASFKNVKGDGDPSSFSANFENLPILTIPDLRNTIAVQHVLERSMLFGARYNEYLLGQFGIAPRDETLQRPIFIGGHTSPIYFDEVVQTSSDVASTGIDSLGRQAGTFVAVGGDNTCNYTVREYGLIMTVMFIRPKNMYRGGMNRQWLKQSRWDFMLPEFSHLSETAIYKGEVATYRPVGGSDTDPKPNNHGDFGVFGYQGMYDWMRSKQDRLVEDYTNIGDPELSGLLDRWTFARKFANEPWLNSKFLHVNPDADYLNAPFTINTSKLPPFIVHIHNKIGAVRPLPADPTPGLNRI